MRNRGCNSITHSLRYFSDIMCPLHTWCGNNTTRNTSNKPSLSFCGSLGVPSDSNFRFKLQIQIHVMLSRVYDILKACYTNTYTLAAYIYIQLLSDIYSQSKLGSNHGFETQFSLKMATFKSGAGDFWHPLAPHLLPIPHTKVLNVVSD